MLQLAALGLLVTALHGSPVDLVDGFDALHALIRPQGDEFAWYEEIPWLTGLTEAVGKASAEGKPILVWCSADGQPCGAT